MAPLGYVAAPSSFERLVNYNLYGAPSLDKGTDEQLEQQTTEGEARPTCSIEYLVEQREIPIVVQTHLLEGCRHGTSASCQEGADHQYECLVPRRAGES